MAGKLCANCGRPTNFFTEIDMGGDVVHGKCVRAYEENQKLGREHQYSDKSGTAEAAANTGTAAPSDYGAARVVSGIGEFLGWVLVLIGVVLVFVSAAQEMGLVGFIVALGVGTSGLFLVMTAQFVRATVNNADTTRDILRFLQTKDK